VSARSREISVISLGRKNFSARSLVMSALPPKTDMCGALDHVR